MPDIYRRQVISMGFKQKKLSMSLEIEYLHKTNGFKDFLADFV